MILMLVVVSSCYAQTDTSSVFIRNLPTIVRSDSNFVLIVESPFTTYQTTWKNLQRSMNFKKLKQTTFVTQDDIIAVTHTNTFDTTKGIKISKFYQTALKDSVNGLIGIAKTSIESRITDSLNMIEAQLQLKASISSVDSVKGRVSNAETLISQKAGLLALDSLRNELYSEIGLRASVSTVDSLKSRAGEIEFRLNDAESSILQKSSITDLENLETEIYSELGLKASVTSVNTLDERLTNAEASITAKASITDLNNLSDDIYSELNLKASASIVDSLSEDVSNALAQITLEAGNRASADGTLQASINLKVSANDVINSINLSTEGVTISASKITLDGDVVANSLSSKTISGVLISAGSFTTIQNPNDYSQRWTFNMSAGSLNWSRANGNYPASIGYNMDYGLTLSGVAFINGYYANNILSKANDAVDAYYVSQNANANLGITSIGTGLTVSGGVLSATGAGSHTHTISDVTGLQTELNDKANYIHGHEIDDIADLWDNLNGKANSIHTHDYNANLGISSIGSGLSITNGVLSSSGTGFSGSYTDLTNIPSTFTPSSHTHAEYLTSVTWNIVSDKPTFFNGSYTSLTNVPSTFTPSAHTHTGLSVVTFGSTGYTEVGGLRFNHVVLTVDGYSQNVITSVEAVQ